MLHVHHQTIRCLTFTAAAHVSPLDLPYLFTQSGEILGELHHHDDKGPSCEHAGGPEQCVEDDTAVVQPGQEDGLLLLTGVVVTRDSLVHLQTLGDVSNHAMHGHTVLLAPGHIETLQRQDQSHWIHLEGNHLVFYFVLVMGPVSLLYFTLLNASPFMYHLSA